MPDTTLGIKAGAVKKAIKVVAPVKHRTPRERKQTGSNKGCWPLAFSPGQVIFNDLSFILQVLTEQLILCQAFGKQKGVAVSQRNSRSGDIESEICSFVSDSLWSHWLYSPWNYPNQNTGVGSFSLLGNVFTNQGDLFKQKEGSFSSLGLWSRLCRSES